MKSLTCCVSIHSWLLLIYCSSCSPQRIHRYRHSYLHILGSRNRLLLLIFHHGNSCNFWRKELLCTGFILEHGLVGFPQFEKKKCCINFTLLCQMGTKKIDPWTSTIFWIKVLNTFFSNFENITDNNTDLITVSIAFLFFVWVIISPDKHPRFCSNLSPGFFISPECFKIVAKHQ